MLVILLFHLFQIVRPFLVLPLFTNKSIRVISLKSMCALVLDKKKRSLINRTCGTIRRILKVGSDGYSIKWLEDHVKSVWQACEDPLQVRWRFWDLLLVGVLRRCWSRSDDMRNTSLEFTTWMTELDRSCAKVVFGQISCIRTDYQSIYVPSSQKRNCNVGRKRKRWSDLRVSIGV